jgi:hypothetical protein
MFGDVIQAGKKFVGIVVIFIHPGVLNVYRPDEKVKVFKLLADMRRTTEKGSAPADFPV